MTSQRTRMRMVERLRAQGITDEAVLTAMIAVPRHIFVEEVLANRAYDDVALPINFGQTISSPFNVARMSQWLRAGSNPDGLRGLPEAGPFEGIILTAATPHVPPALLEQLTIRGRMIFPRGSNEQVLCVIERNLQGYTETILDEVRFVPMMPGMWKR